MASKFRFNDESPVYQQADDNYNAHDIAVNLSELTGLDFNEKDIIAEYETKL